MAPVQIVFIVLTFVAPVALWSGRRWFQPEVFDLVVCRTLAVLLVGTLALEFTTKLALEHLPLGRALPMQLCDWALFAAAGALWFRWRLAFEVTYFWGLAGTLQALFTPALDRESALWRQLAFFFIHSGIVMAVLYLMLALRCRPRARSLWHVVLFSELYVATALAANALTGANYGFLSHKPAQASMLDLFAADHWLYVAQVNLTGLVFFFALYLPWLVRDLAAPRPTNPASRDEPAP